MSEADVKRLQDLLAHFKGLKTIRNVNLVEGWDEEGESWTLMWRQGFFRRDREIEGPDPTELLEAAIKKPRTWGRWDGKQHRI